MLACLAFASVLSAPACSWFHPFDFAQGARLTGGDPELGRRALALHSCISCHTIPGVPKGDGNSAPSLAHWSRHTEFIGTHPNTPENLVQWLSNPAHVKPGTKMPNMNVSDKDSRDMAAYLFSIQ
jgi:cytochrome c